MSSDPRTSDDSVRAIPSADLECAEATQSRDVWRIGLMDEVSGIDGD
jgi:hypothetical protein